MKAELLSVGSELTSGLTVDTNSAWLAGRLARLGIEVGRQVTVGDDLDAIKEALREAAGRSEVVVVTGGLGPTEDDRTRQAVAAALGVGVRTDEAVLEGIRAMFRRRRARWSESNARQALIPEGAQPIENPWGTAAGIRAEVGDSLVYCLPGVPAEMERMFEASVGPELADFGATGVLLTHTLRCFGAGESRIGEQIADLMGGTGPVRVGTTAHEAVIGIRFFVRGRTRDQAQGLLDEAVVEVRQRLGPLVFGEGQATLESAVGGILGSRGLTLATAESSTGGLLAKRLTDVPGSSAYFLRGLVTYANRAKVELLGIAPSLIERQGAVSEAVARAMASGCRERAGAELALATTGIAGPGGATADKPVGLVYVGLAGSGGCEVHEFRFGGHLSRASIRERACSSALNLLRRHLD